MEEAALEARKQEEERLAKLQEKKQKRDAKKQEAERLVDEAISESIQFELENLIKETISEIATINQKKKVNSKQKVCK